MSTIFGSGGIGNAESTTTNTTTNQNVAGGATQSYGQSLALGAGATLNLNQESPGALGALQGAVGQSLATNLEITRAGQSLAQHALDLAKPDSANLISALKWVAVAVAVVFALKYWKGR